MKKTIIICTVIVVSIGIGVLYQTGNLSFPNMTSSIDGSLNPPQTYEVNTSCELVYFVTHDMKDFDQRTSSPDFVKKYPEESAKMKKIFENPELTMEIAQYFNSGPFDKQKMPYEFAEVFASILIKEYSINPDLKTELIYIMSGIQIMDYDGYTKCSATKNRNAKVILENNYIGPLGSAHVQIEEQSAEQTTVPTEKEFKISLKFIESPDFRTLAFNALPTEEEYNPEIRVKSGSVITIEVKNWGKSFHAFGIVTNAEDPATLVWNSAIKDPNNPLKPGETGEVTFTTGASGTYYYICTVPG
ncbi:MAG: hypothetical protein ACRD90_06235, partial [Nitrosopumilaceae archaeon]